MIGSPLVRPSFASIASLAGTVAFSLALGCTKPDGAPIEQPDGGQGTQTTPEPSKPKFENPGGMWMPAQLAEAGHSKTLEELGLAFDPLALTKPTEFPLGAIIGLGGCSASFVSPDGLLVTNHHCVTGALNYNSKEGQNLHHTGYLAKDRSQELWAGPTQRVYVTRSFTDVTEQVLGGLDGIEDPQQRWAEVGKRRKELAAKCEEGKTDTRCTIASFFEGAQFFQIEQLELRDIRLVYAPHEGVGVYGGEIDNWRWPRHTGDYSFYRAYVGPDGQPADHASTNVPYKPAHHLKIATGDLDEGDLVFVAGYPGKTSRLKTAAEVAAAVDWYYPRRIARFEQYIDTLELTAGSDEGLKIKAEPILRSLNNGLTNSKGQLEGLSKGLAKQRADEEQALREWIAADEQRKAKYGTVLDELGALDAAALATREQDAHMTELAASSALLVRAMMIVDAAEKRDAGAAPSDKDIAEIRKQLDVSQTRYAQALDKAVLRLHLERAAQLPAEQQPALLRAIVPTGDITPEAIAAAAHKLYPKTKLEDVAQVIKLYSKATTKELKKSKDPFIQLALKVEPDYDAMEAREAASAGKFALLRPLYIAALREFAAGQGKTLAPDANLTLRVSYGTVRGYRPRPDAEVYVPFTTASQMLAKHTGEDPFDLPEPVRKGIEGKNYGPYADPELGELPIDFLADLDITGGSSGSATLNARGELVGLVFDGNYEAMAGDWLFMPELQRSIHVDIRSVLWMMDAIDGADHLLKEMGIEGAI